MKYLPEVTIDGVTYEAWCTVYDNGDSLDVGFSTMLAYIDNRVEHTDTLPDLVQDDLLDAAIDMYRMDDGADAAYDAMRDA
jgi:hypothetical protein